MSTDIILKNKSDDLSVSSTVLISVPIKSLTHSALKELCFSCGLYNTNDIIKQKNSLKELEYLRAQVEQFTNELQIQKNKNKNLESDLKKKENEYNIMYEQGVKLCDRSNEMYEQFKIQYSELKKENDKLKQQLEQFSSSDFFCKKIKQSA